MFFKKVASVIIGIGLSSLVGLAAVLTINSETPTVAYMGMLVAITAIGALLIGGVYFAILIGRELCERIFGWFY